MQIIKTASQMTNLCRQLRQKKKLIAFVPTMGALHEGHLALMRDARRYGDVVIVSIYVNPRQFNDPKDFEKYSRDLEGDLKKCQAVGVDIVFAPTDDEIYPPGKALPDISVPDVGKSLEGTSRPGHFQGVVTVVHRLFSIIAPDFALFGQKDFQQLRVIEEMVKSQKLPITIVRHPTVREKDGLAMSSRNVRLSALGRRRAIVIYRALQAADQLYQSGEHRRRLLEEAVHEVLQKEKSLTIDYVAIVDADTLKKITIVRREALVAIAVSLEGVRLIDNGLLVPSKIRSAA